MPDKSLFFLFPLRNNTSNETNAGKFNAQTVLFNVCFLERKRYLSKFLRAFCVSLYMHTVCVCAEMAEHTLDLPHQILPVLKKQNEQQASRATKWLLWRKKQTNKKARAHPKSGSVTFVDSQNFRVETLSFFCSLKWLSLRPN